MTDVFMTVLNMSATAAFVIAALCLARLALRRMRAPKWISYAMWAVAGFNLLCPFKLSAPVSLLPQNMPEVALPSHFIYDQTLLAPGVMPEAGRYIESGYSYAVVWNFSEILAYAWIAGIAAMLLYAAISYIRLMRNKDSAGTPFVYGFVKPKIHMPGGLAGEQLRYATLHEQTHIKRRDHLVKLLAFSILCIHWFNPFAWLAFALLCADMEMSCDERVLRELGMGAKADYSQALLSLSMNRRILGASPLAFGEGGVKERVKNVLNFKKPARAVLVAAVALVAVLSVGFAVNRAGREKYANFSAIAIDGYAISRNAVDGLRTIGLYENGIGAMTIFLAHAENGDTPSFLNKNAQNITAIEQIEELLGKGKLVKLSPSENGQPLREERYASENGLTVSFIYVDGEDGGIMHRLYRVDWGISEAGDASRPSPGEATVAVTELAALRTPYVGDNSAVGKIVDSLPPLGARHTQRFFSIGDDYGTGRAQYTLTVYYEQDGKINGDYAITPRNAVILFALIDNLEEVNIAIRYTPSGDELDESAYSDRYANNRAELGEYLSTAGLAWDDFHDDWEGSLEAAFALIGSGELEQRPQTPPAPLSERRPMLMADGALYFGTGRQILQEPGKTAIFGKITSTVSASEPPAQNGQSNFGSKGAAYAFFDGSLAVSLNGKWFLFEKDPNISRLSSWAPLDELPVDYGQNQAVADGVYVNIHGSEIYNEYQLTRFISDSRAGTQAFLREMQYTVEGDLVITDYLFDGETFTVTYDATRDAFGSQDITARTYRYMVEYTPTAEQGYLGTVPILLLSNTQSVTEAGFNNGEYWQVP
jgi:beta-lactamase regulating signal transducer with metallopeptidase domain